MTYEEEIRSKPVGKVVKVYDDGTTLVEFDLDHQAVQEIVVGYIVGGSEVANQILKRQQAIGTN
jgi:hypothetical protein